MTSARTFRRFSVAVLVYNLAVIVWGAYVRASGSGAGCGSHWPTCNGEIVPHSPAVHTLIEFTHRAMSGLALLSVAALVYFAIRVYPRGSAVRSGAIASMVFMLTEAAVGAGLVLLEHVAGDRSASRAAWAGMHLTNTFLLLGALNLTIFRAHGGGRPRWADAGVRGALAVTALGGVLLLGVSGSIAALGDTLFPARTLTEGMQQDLSSSAHLFIRLRVWHPVLAIIVAAFVVTMTMIVAGPKAPPRVRQAGSIAGGLFLLQVCIGGANLAMLAPIPLQLLHLLTADCIWLALVWLAAAVLEEPAASRTGAQAAPLQA